MAPSLDPKWTPKEEASPEDDKNKKIEDPGIAKATLIILFLIVLVLVAGFIICFLHKRTRNSVRIRFNSRIQPNIVDSSSMKADQEKEPLNSQALRSRSEAPAPSLTKNKIEYTTLIQ